MAPHSKAVDARVVVALRDLHAQAQVRRGGVDAARGSGARWMGPHLDGAACVDELTQAWQLEPGDEREAGPATFVVTWFGLPIDAIRNLGFKMKSYRMSDERDAYVLAPWEGSAFQALGLELSMTELDRPSWRQLLENIVDVEIDFATRHKLPGFLSESYSGEGVQYTGSVGITDITVSPLPRITDAASLYTLRAAYSVAPEKIERFLEAKADTYARKAIELAKADKDTPEENRSITEGFAHQILGYVLLRQEKTPAAITELKTASTMLKSDPTKYSITLYRLGFAYAKTNQVANAKQVLTEAVGVEGPLKDAAKELGVAAADIPASTSRGKETFFDGKVFDPENPAAYLKSLSIKRVEV